MKKCKFGLMLYAILCVFGCQTKENVEVTQKEMREYYRGLSSREKRAFDQLNDREKAKSVRKRFKTNELKKPVALSKENQEKMDKAIEVFKKTTEDIKAFFKEQNDKIQKKMKK